MSCNVELKAVVRDPQQLRARVDRLPIKEKFTLSQRDIFFSFPMGRLKYRQDQVHEPELILYFRPDAASLKKSHYIRMRVPRWLRSILTPIGRRWPKQGEVRKTRTVYLLDDTRIHLDDVEEIGSYVELEILVSKSNPQREAWMTAAGLTDKLGIRSEDMCDGAYLDLVRSRYH